MKTPRPGTLLLALLLFASLPAAVSSCSSRRVTRPSVSGGAPADPEGGGSGAFAGDPSGAGGVVAPGSGGEAASGGAAGADASAGASGSGTEESGGNGGTLSGGAGGTLSGGAGGTLSGGAGGTLSGGGAPPSGGDDAGGASSDRMTCQLGCETNLDCASATGTARFCDPAHHTCVECAQHVDCIPFASGWSTSICDEDDDCLFFGDVCVDVNGAGRCATPPDDLGCVFAGELPLTFMKLVGHEPVEVCGVEAGRCQDNRCIVGCGSDENACPGAGNGDGCDPVSGQCTCASDAECLVGPQHCNLQTQRCDECATASDCASAPTGQGTCVNGRCGCESATGCADPDYPSAAPLCQ